MAFEPRQSWLCVCVGGSTWKLWAASLSVRLGQVVRIIPIEDLGSFRGWGPLEGIWGRVDSCETTGPGWNTGRPGQIGRFAEREICLGKRNPKV